MVYLAADKPLSVVAWNEAEPGFNVSDLAEDEQRVKCQFSKQHVVYAGAHEGCGCGFQCAEYGHENYEPEELNRCRRALEEFSEYLRGELERVGTIELFASWDGDQAAPPDHHRKLTPGSLMNPNFFFLERELSTIVADVSGPVWSRLKVEFHLSLEDFLETRDELRGILNDPGTPLEFPHVLLILFAFVALASWNWISAGILSLGLLIVFATIASRNFLRRRGLRLHFATLRADYERFSSGLCTFEADDKGWRLSAGGEEQAHAWEEVRMIKDSPRVLYLMTYSGTCTLPKAAFSAEQLAQLKVWCE
jgi:YcxB-like protein